MLIRNGSDLRLCCAGAIINVWEKCFGLVGTSMPPHQDHKASLFTAPADETCILLQTFIFHYLSHQLPIYFLLFSRVSLSKLLLFKRKKKYYGLLFCILGFEQEVAEIAL